MQLRNPFKHKPKPIVIEPIGDTEKTDLGLNEDVAAEQVPKSNGKVIKAKKAPAYKLPTIRPAGGRVVRTIPKNLRKMKEYAESEDQNS